MKIKLKVFNYYVTIVTGIMLHLCAFKTPTSWAFMTEQGDADCVFEMRSGVKKSNIHFLKYELTGVKI
jgi:hypothetical protein